MRYNYLSFFLIAWIFVLSLGQLGRLQLTPSIAVYVHEFLMLGYLLWQLPQVIVQRKKIIQNFKKINNFSKKIIFLLILSIILSWSLAIIQNSFDYRSLLYTLRFVTYVVFVLLLQRQLRFAAWPWLVISFNLLMLGFVQYFLLPDLRFIVYEGFDDHFYRLAGTLLDPSFLGLIFVFNLIHYLSQKKYPLLLVLAFIIALALTYARAAYGAFLLSGLFIFYKAPYPQTRLHIAFLSALFCMVLPFLPTTSGGAGVNLRRSFTLEQRMTINQQALQTMNQREWLIGQGLFHPSDRSSGERQVNAHFPDNILVFLVSRLGIIGTALVFGLIWKNIDWKDTRKVALLIALITHSMFNHNLTQSFVLLLFLGLYYSRNSTSMLRSS